MNEGNLGSLKETVGKKEKTESGTGLRRHWVSQSPSQIPVWD